MLFSDLMSRCTTNRELEVHLLGSTTHQDVVLRVDVAMYYGQEVAGTTFEGAVLTRMFSGLMSRCTMDSECRYLRAEARLYTMPLASRSVYLVADEIASNRSPPWNHHRLDWVNIQFETF